MPAQAVGQVTKGESDRVGALATANYRVKAAEDDEDDEVEVEAHEEEEEEETGAQGRRRRRSRMLWPANMALFKPLSSSPQLRFVASQPSYSPS